MSETEFLNEIRKLPNAVLQERLGISIAAVIAMKKSGNATVSLCKLFGCIEWLKSLKV